MIFRLANIDDLSEIKSMYKKIVENMNANHLNIWDEVYPVEFIEEDIENHQFYVLCDNDQIIAGLSLSKTHDGEDSVEWSEKNEKVLYIDRLGVNVDYLRKGMGTLVLNETTKFAREMGMQYLRLFVVNINIPAICLYNKLGFKKAKGIYDEIIDNVIILQELGFEILL